MSVSHCIANKSSPFSSYPLWLASGRLDHYSINILEVFCWANADCNRRLPCKFLKVLALFLCVFCALFNSLKVEMEKMTNEKGEMHRHYIMVNFYSAFYYQIYYIYNLITDVL